MRITWKTIRNKTPLTFLLTAFILSLSFLISNAFGFRQSDMEKLLSTGNCAVCDLSGANLSGANLSEANLFETNLSETNLSGADLTGADLWKANLSGADLSGANLSEANLTGANLWKADLTKANLSGANLDMASLSDDADLSEANLTGIKYPPLEVKEEFEVRRIMELKKEGLCSKKFPKAKNMITVKGLYIGMNFCDVLKMYETSKYKSVLQRMHLIPRYTGSYFKIDNEGRVTKIHFRKNVLHELFKSKDMSLKMFAENFGNHYIEGKSWEMEPYNDAKNNSYGYKYYNGEVGYKFFIKQNKSGTGVESLTIEEVAKVSEGFGD